MHAADETKILQIGAVKPQPWMQAIPQHQGILQRRVGAGAEVGAGAGAGAGVATALRAMRTIEVVA